jgi:dynein heavy chain 1
MVMESVCTLLGHKVDSWKSVQTILRRDDFISSIVNYSTENFSPEIRIDIQMNYLSDENYNFENVNRASKACGPLMQWVVAQVSYSTILENVAPLREELQLLECKACETQSRSVDIEKIIGDLEHSISVYKEEYASLIRDTQTLTNEMDLVKSRLDRSVQLLKNLTSEKDRWHDSSLSFSHDIETLVGDVLLSSAYLCYGGSFDQNIREIMLNLWLERLDSVGISHQKRISIPEYLTTEEQRTDWFNNQLPSDSLCLENAVMLDRHTRFPLIIDPSGQALVFIQNQYKKRGIITTRYYLYIDSSFRDTSYVKLLESAIRFGNPIILQDVEMYDPIIKNVLDQQVRRIGGRCIVRLGTKDVDFSPSFMLFMTTKVSECIFSPSLLSRVSIVNFSLTPASLRIQCTERILRSERPDIDFKLKELLKIQGEFQLRLLVLEKSLLASLNNSKGNILDDDDVLNTLERLKQEAIEITAKIEQTDVILEEVNLVSSQYEGLAENCSTLYFVMQQISSIRPFYQFSLEYFFFLFDKVITKKSGKRRTAKILEDEIFTYILSRLAASLKDEDLMLFALLAAEIMDKSMTEERLFLISEESELSNSIDGDLLDIIGKSAAGNVSRLSKIRPFKFIANEISSSPELWRNIMLDPRPEDLLELTSLSEPDIGFQLYY